MNRSALVLSLLRIVAGMLFWQHGLQKVFGWLGGEAAATFSPLWALGVLELIGGLLILLGLLTRPVALILLAEMAIVYFVQYQPRGFWAVNNDGEVYLQYALIFLVFLVIGPGSIALDARSSSLKAPLSRLTSFTPVTLSVLRIATGFLFWQHGAAKFGLLEGRVRHFPELQFFAGIVEFFGGILIVLGLGTRLAAFLCSGQMAIAFWRSRLPLGSDFWPIADSNEKAVLFCFVFLFMFGSGISQWSIDWLRNRKSMSRSKEVKPVLEAAE